MKRPKHLPDFKNPPLNEVVLGVQFAPARNYQQIRAYEVWKLYQKTFPHVEEYPPIQPTFETFGLPSAPTLNFGIVTGATHDRFWFLSEKKDELIQFQNDRLLHNWRKVGDGQNPYPRFETMLPSFQKEIQKLEGYFGTLATQKLEINQCEISYINHIYQDELLNLLGVDDVLSFVQFSNGRPDDFNSTFRRTISDGDRGPIGRLICEAQTAVNSVNRRKMIVLSLTARGAPKTPTIEDALEFIKLGREIVVSTFAEVTSERCHQMWGRTR